MTTHKKGKLLPNLHWSRLRPFSSLYLTGRADSSALHAAWLSSGELLRRMVDTGKQIPSDKSDFIDRTPIKRV